MFNAQFIQTKSSPKRMGVYCAVIVICTVLLWVSSSNLPIKIFFNLFLLGLGCYLIWQERKVLQLEWKLLDDIHIKPDDSKNPYKLSSCIVTSWYCVLGLTDDSGSYKKLHIWFDQLDEQNAWQLRCNIHAWKEKTP